MGYKMGMPSMKLNNNGTKSRHCGGFGQVAREGLSERIGLDPDIDKSKSYLNYYEGYKTAAELIAYSEKHIAELSEQLRAEGKRGIRSDAVVMCATILKPPTEYMQQLTPEKQKELLKDGVEVFKKLVGAGKVKAIAMHFDEQQPHAHIFWEPMTKDGRLCAREMHSLKFFSKVNKEMPARLRQKGWDIDDCKIYDKEQAEQNAEKKQKDGRSSAEYKADMEAQKEHYKAVLAEVEKIDEIEVKPSLTKKDKVVINKDDFDSLKSQAKAYALHKDEISSLGERENAVRHRENRVTEREMTVSDDEFEINNRFAELIEREGEIDEKANEAWQLYDKQIDINQRLEQAENDCSELQYQNGELIEQLQEATSENRFLKAQISDLKSRLRETKEKYEKRLERVMQRVKEVVRAYNAIFFAKTDDFSLFERLDWKQQAKVRGIMDYAEDTAIGEGYAEFGAEMQKEYGESKGIQKAQNAEMRQGRVNTIDEMSRDDWEISM